MKEFTDTTARTSGNKPKKNFLIPEDRYMFVVEFPVEKRKSDNGNLFYLWKLKALKGAKTYRYTYVCMVWKAGEILRALRQKEIKPGAFDWDRDAIVGGRFEADIVHEPDYKDRSITRGQLANFSPYPARHEEPLADDMLGDPPPETDVVEDPEIPF